MANGNTPQIKGESVQALYRLYNSEKLLANRRYQRKLVWSIDEKRSFIDSIQKGFPIPIILLAEVGSGEVGYEIIDGMQRLNAIMSFIEQEYSIGERFFDLNTMAETKDKLDNGVLSHAGNTIDRADCIDFVGYQVPVSVYRERDAKRIDDVFKRLNSNGRYLSRQELRQAGATGEFANVVRRLSANIRGDSSVGDVLSLNKMKNISLTNKDLQYGVNIDNVFWIKNKILTKEDLRNSKDEEIIADIVAWVISEKAQRSSSDVLDGYYGFSDDVDASQQVDRSINKYGSDVIVENMQACFDLLMRVSEKSSDNLSALLFKGGAPRFPRFFQLYFIAIYENLFLYNKEIDNYSGLMRALKNSGDGINLAEGGGNWSAAEKDRGINQVHGIIKESFKKCGKIDPSRRYWISRFENILMNSTTEQTLYDFKMGFYDLHDDVKFNSDLFDKSIKMLTAMANTNKGAVGYVVVGVCDKKSTAMAHKKFYSGANVKYGSFI